MTKAGKTCRNLSRLVITTRISFKTLKRTSQGGRSGSITKGLRSKNFRKDMVNWHPSKSCWSWESSGPIESWMAWRDSLSMLTKMISLSNHPLSTMRKYIKLRTKGHRLCLSCPQVRILSRMFKNWPSNRDSQGTSSSTWPSDRACRSKPTYIFPRPPTGDTGLCYRTVTYYLPGWKIIWRSSYKHSVGLTKISGSGWQRNRLMPSHSESSRNPSRSLLSLQMESNSTWDPHCPSCLKSPSTNVPTKHSNRSCLSFPSSMLSSKIVVSMVRLDGMSLMTSIRVTLPFPTNCWICIWPKLMRTKTKPSPGTHWNIWLVRLCTEAEWLMTGTEES